ncbi:MAG: FUSC family protein [Alphaproteobacteria bacterium]|nr:FUSC family protein [Alphaproteobacteria bacterium]
MISGSARPPALLRRAEHDLSRRQFGLDLRALNLLEGLRAALSVAVLVAANEWLHWPPMMEAGLAAWLTCLCDQGGPIRRRLPSVLMFTVAGAVLTATVGLARAGGLPVAVPLAGFGLFALSFIRIYGQQAMVVGNLLGVVLVLSLDRPLPDLATALTLAGAFVGGGLWATLLTMLVWRMHPYLPARRAVSAVYLALAADAQDLRGRLRHVQPHSRVWEEHARAHRRAVRDAIELARAAVLDTLRVRGAPATRGAHTLIRLEIADQVFNALIALSEELEHGATHDRAASDRLLRRLRAVLIVLGRAIQTDDTKSNRQIERSLAAMAGDVATLPPEATLRRIGTVIVERLRMALTLNMPANYHPGTNEAGERTPLRERLIGPLRANLNWQSLALRHALRAGVVAAPAIAITVIWYGPYEHWLTITLVLTLQPYFATTITRALERVGGTILGGVVAALLALICTTPLAIAIAMFPLAIIALAVRQVSYGLFMAAITPIVVLLSELGRPGISEWVLAGMRALSTAVGGLLALGGAFLLWPSWEPARLPAEIRAAIAAHGAYARATLSFVLGEIGEAAFHESRRAAGVANNNLEASLSRVLQEPRHISPDELEAAMVIDAALRRMAGRLSVMQLDPTLAVSVPADELRRWRDWIGSALRAVADRAPMIEPRPPVLPGPAGNSLARAARQVELMAGAMERLPG